MKFIKAVSFFGLFIAATTLLGLVGTPATRAQSQGEGSLKQPAGTPQGFRPVEINCLAVKRSLLEVHERDGLARVVIGQKYETVSGKLISPLNTRIAQNSIDGSNLIRIGSQYHTALEKFRTDYRLYEELLNTLIKADCKSQEIAYYDTLDRVRSLRVEVGDDCEQIARLLKEYRQAVVELKERLQSQDDDNGQDNVL